MIYMIRDMMKRKTTAALLSIALGIVIIIARRAALDLLVKIIGGMVITCGLAFIAVYLTRPDPGRGNLKMVLLMSAFTVLVGLLLIYFAEDVVNFFPTMMGIVLILNGLSHLTTAGVDRENRVLAGLLGVATILFGILIVMQPGFIADAIMVYIGAFFIVNGLMDLVIVRRFLRDGV